MLKKLTFVRNIIADWARSITIDVLRIHRNVVPKKENNKQKHAQVGLHDCFFYSRHKQKKTKLEKNSKKIYKKQNI